MPTLDDLAAAAPPIAAFVRQKVATTGLCLLGTMRSDGWPRVSPLELFEHDGRLYMGSMPNAVKARDLQRDGRCCILTPLADKDDLEGDAKLFCRAREIADRDEWEAVRQSFLQDRGFDMGAPGGSHLFTFDIEGAAWQRVDGDEWRTSSWSAGGGVRERVRTGPLGESRDL